MAAIILCIAIGTGIMCDRMAEKGQTYPALKR